MNIAVLAGGRSPEHDVSLNSTEQVLANLDRR
ncbi:MAG: D-ala D-ala ligase N-terminus, partial [Planctomycetota bacterium]